jgi:hypothetical protein
LTAQRTICQHCTQVIGVYEPMVVVDRGGARETSRAAEPGVETAPGERYHLGCYRELKAGVADARRRAHRA